MLDSNKYRFQVDTYAPGLKPKTNKKDEEKIKKLYSDLGSRLRGIDSELSKLGVERLVIDVIKKGGLADDRES